MLVLTQFILFLIYTSLIFFIKSYYLLAFVFGINIILMIVLKINAKKACTFLFKLLPFILFTSVLNILLGELELGILCRNKINFSLQYYIYIF